MSDIALKVENVSKLYRLGQNIGYKTLRDSFTNLMSASFRRLCSGGKSGYAKEKTDNHFEYLWALKNISFKIKEGESVAIIGNNGAGKSTLLKILSRITTPTEGNCEIHGKVGSLLEVGTGFHPELTGGENIFFNGSILGMKKTDIKRMFDEIVTFAGIEKFVDTPVKRYSSGMYIRLGFAVAAHLEPDILVVDEVLSVGDAAFQKKCMQKMDSVAKGGRTVLFVSHNMAAVKALCPRSILLDQGLVKMSGNTQEVLQYYLGDDGDNRSQIEWPVEKRPGNGSFKINSIKLKGEQQTPCTSLNISKGGYIEINFSVIDAGAQSGFCLGLYDSYGVCLFESLSNVEPYYYSKPLRIGNYQTTCRIPSDFLSPGVFSIRIIGFGQHWSDSIYLENVISFSAVDDGVLRGDYFGLFNGSLRPKLEWRTTQIT